MKHKLHIYSTNNGRRRLWYTSCACGWEPDTRSEATGRWGRPTLDAALAVGVAHQHNVELKEKLADAPRP